LAVTLNITVTNPTGTNSVAVYPTTVDLSHELNEPSVFTMYFEYGWEYYENWNTLTNPVQDNSYVVFTRNGVFTWQGYIVSGQKVEENGERKIKIVCHDALYKLQKTNAGISGSTLFTTETPAIAVSQLKLYKLASAIGDATYPFYPAPTDTYPWIPAASSESTTLDANINAAVTEITATTSQEGFTPLGLIKIGTEWIFYDGYDYTSTNGKYRFRNCQRGALGTTAATHAGGDTIYQRKSQIIHPSHAVFVEAYNVAKAKWEPLKEDSFNVVANEGRFEFTYDILAFPSPTSKYNDLRATYAVFDEANVLISASTTGVTQLTTLISAGAGFISGGVRPWYRVNNTTDGSTAYVISVDTANQCTTTVLSGGTDNDYDFNDAFTISATVDLRGILTAVLSESIVNLGPGLVAGTSFEIGASLGDIKITRVRLSKVTNTWDFIRNLLDEIGLNKGASEDAIGIYYDHTNSIIKIEAVDQKSAALADQALYGMTLIDRDHTLSTVSSAINVQYSAGQNSNLAAWQRTWHVAKGDVIGGKTCGGFYYMEKESTEGASRIFVQETTNNSAFTPLMFDNIDASGYGISILSTTGDPTEADLIYHWFNGDLAEAIIDEIEIILDARNISIETNPYHFRILGIKKFDEPISGGGVDWTADPTTIVSVTNPDSIVEISGALDLRFPSGSTAAYGKVKLGAKNIGVKLVGLVDRWYGMAQIEQGGNQRIGMIKELSVRGFTTRTVRVQLTNSDAVALDSTYLYAPLAYNKLLRYYSGAAHISHQVSNLEIGQATYDSAISLGRLALLQGLAYKQSRFYEIQAHLENINIPNLTKTVTCADGFTGVLISRHYSAASGFEHFSCRVLDFTDLVI